jgi:O-antigen biosynthesis protein
VTVLDVDLAGAEPIEDRGRGAYVLLRLHGTPIAELWCTPESIPRERAALLGAAIDAQGVAVVRRLLRRALESPLHEHPLRAETLLAPASRESFVAPSLTVVVCTRDRPIRLERALRAIRGSLRAPDEILVIDNASQPGRAAEIAQRLGARHAHEPVTGLNRARQRGVGLAAGEILAFTDDDAVPDPGWTEAVARAFGENPDVDALTGLVLPLELETESQLAFEAYGGFRRGLERRFVRASEPRRPIALDFGNIGRLGTGANMAFRRAALLRAGPFDPALDVGTTVGGAGDLEMLFRMLKHGHGIVYEPSAAVWHEHRREPEELLRQIESWGRGFAGYAEATSQRFPEERLGLDMLLAWLTATWHLRRLFLPTTRERFPRTLVVAELRGLAAGRACYRETGAAGEVPVPSARLGAGRVAEREIDLAEPLGPITGLPNTRTVRLRVLIAGDPVGTVELSSGGRPIGVSRIRDAIVARLRDQLLGPYAPGELRAGLVAACQAGVPTERGALARSRR